MKCVQTKGAHSVVLRVTDDDAAKMVQSGKAVYVPKSVWKMGRDLAATNMKAGV